MLPVGRRPEPYGIRVPANPVGLPRVYLRSFLIFDFFELCINHIVATGRTALCTCTRGARATRRARCSRTRRATLLRGISALGDCSRRLRKRVRLLLDHALVVAL